MCTNYLTDFDQFDILTDCRFYLSLDPRVRPVILFIKHWAHCHKLTGPSNITNYALTWLVIFYLQEASGFGLPSVELLQNRHEGPVKIIAGE
jgi:DNA polymerase sigma